MPRLMSPFSDSEFIGELWEPDQLPGLIGWYSGARPETFDITSSLITKLRGVKGYGPDNTPLDTTDRMAWDPVVKPGSVHINRIGFIAHPNYIRNQMDSDLTGVKASIFAISDMNGSRYSTPLGTVYSSTNGTDEVFIRNNNDDYDISVNGTATNNATVHYGGSETSYYGDDLTIGSGLTQAEKAGPMIWSLLHDNTVTVQHLMHRGLTIEGRGTLGTILFFDRALSDRERNLCEGYVAWVHHMQSSLVDGHKFKGRPPMRND